jgi:hypothetical protein
MDGVESGTFPDSPPQADAARSSLPKFRFGHYVHRMGEQLMSNALYGGA